MTIDAYCQRVIKDMEATWQRLPISSELCGTHPIPLRATLRIHEGSKEPRNDKTTHYSSPQDAIDAALKENRPVVVFGGPGAGKTSAMKWIARTQAKRVLEDGDHQTAVPAYVDLGLHKSKADLDAVQAYVRKDNPELSEGSAVMWLLDGLDLLTERDLLSAAAVIGRAFALQRQGRDIFVCSTRESPAVTSALDNEGKSLRVSLESLTPDERAKWVDANCPRVKASLTKFEQGSNRTFLNTPLLFAMVLSALIDEGKTGQPFHCTEYDGRAGLFHGFVAYALARAVEDRHITQGERAHLDHEAVEGVFWAAIDAGKVDRISAGDLPLLCERAFGWDIADARHASWKTAAWTLTKAGLLLAPHSEGGLVVLHQQFAEYWAARHLARRLTVARDGGWFAAEVWGHARRVRLDPVLGQALSIASKDRHEIQLEAYRSVSAARPSSGMQLLVHAGGKRAVDALISALEDSQAPSDVRGRAAEALGRIGDVRAVDSLISAVNERQAPTYVLSSATYALGQIGDARAADALISALKDNQAPPAVRGQAAYALGEIGDARAVDALISTLKDSRIDSHVRGLAAEVLGEIGDARAVDALIPALKDSRAGSRVRQSAAFALGRIGNARATDALTSALKDKKADSDLRWPAAYALGQINDARAVDALLSALRDREADPDARGYAAIALGQIGCASAVEALISALKDKQADPKVRGSAADALGEIRDARAVDALGSVLKDGQADLYLHWRVTYALALIGNARAADALISALGDKGGHPATRTYAAYALAEIGDARAADTLISALKDRRADPEARSRAAEFLGKIQHHVGAVDALISALNDAQADSDVRWCAAHALGRAGGARAVDPLIWALKDKEADPKVRWSAAVALGQIGDARAVDALLAALVDDSTRKMSVDIRCAEALSSIGKDAPERYCLEFVEKGRARDISYTRLFSICLKLGMRVEPWHMEEELAAQRAKRAEAEFLIDTGGAIVVENKEGNVIIVKDSTVEGGMRQQVVSGSHNKASQDGQSDPLWSLVTKVAGKVWKWLRALFGAPKP